MKFNHTIFITLLLTISSFLGKSYGQHITSDQCRILELSILKQIKFQHQPMVVKFDFKLTESMISMLKKLEIVPSQVLTKVNTYKSEIYEPFNAELSCSGIGELFFTERILRKEEDFREYGLISLALPVIVEECKAYLFFDHLIMQKGRGVAGGCEGLHIFSKQDGEWILESGKMLEMY
ncbi:hypothetical protein [Robertkochia solimangrovi]|uniref:hypothetical protein n=1 Tax=Robertkochia solimangrovi TaxID=2213046 RepID=UPI00117EFA21|nr:hypothetical protein [Robertkochia solimangrovi]TRZ41642.1 hypothetical protein DMZ48_16675 [Robertkochia solimangrovi]